MAEVNTAVNQMDQVTQQNAAMVEETNVAGATLAVEASRLKELITQFKFDGSRPAVRATDRTDRPVASPVRALGQKLTSVFGGFHDFGTSPLDP